ncbi:MAG: hypothetical protein CMI04_08800 [Oceanospirillaceae bacterium]|nr:hypothetical protein [Oceanospirillaceae bacterium]
MTELVLIADGREYTGWKTASVFRSLQQGPHAFELEISPEQRDANLFNITDGMACELWFKDDLISTGAIDDVLRSYTSDRHQISIKGRSKVADLVDCSTNGQQIVRGQSLQAIARSLAAPFGVSVAVDKAAASAAAQAFEAVDVTLDPGQPIWQLLEELARLRGVMLTSAPNGDLVITRTATGVPQGSLVYGDNILSAELRTSHRELFSEYSVCGMQAAWSGSAEDNSQSAASVKGRAIRHRPFFLQAEDQADAAACKARAAHQARVSYGRSRAAQVTVSGWRVDGFIGPVWQPNALVTVDDARLQVSGDLLAVDIVSSLTRDTGHTTTLTLMPAEAFDLLATEKKGAAW